MEQLIRVLVVDDSAYVRKVVKEMLGRSPFIEVVGAARDGEEALQSAGEIPLGPGRFGGPRGLRGQGPRGGEFLEQCPFVAGVTLHRLDEVGDEIAPLFQMNVDVRPGGARRVPQADEPVVQKNRVENESGRDGGERGDKGKQRFSLRAPAGSALAHLSAETAPS